MIGAAYPFFRPLFIIWLLYAATAHAATLHDPALRFRTLTTEHFFIYYHQGEDQLAARLAAIAEETWTRLREPLGARRPSRTHVVLADETDSSNGFATPIPYNTVFVTAVWPPGSEFIGNTEDWLRLVFTHEFTHILHLDRSEGWARVVRTLFGRTPIAFPNQFLPTWQIEGLATYEESAVTGEGRLHAGDFQAIVREAARARSVEPLDRVNGGLTDWPGGLAPYAYGLGFHAYLSDRFGAEKLATLADATARRVPYTASRVFKRIFGESLGDLWREYEAALERATATGFADADGKPLPTSSSEEVRRLTHHGFAVSGPRFLPVDCIDCPAQIVYSVRTPHQFPALNRLVLDGTPPERVTTRFFGSTVAVTRETIVFDQQEIRRNTGHYSDLYAFDRKSGNVRRLTSEQRLLDPDFSPDGQTIAAVQVAPGRRDLVVVRIGRPPEITVLLSERETQFNAPRWSPDGRTIAVEQHRAGELSRVILVDVVSRTVRTIAANPRARSVTPVWRRDGRAVVAAVSFDDEPFNLYEFSVDRSAEPRQITHTTGGATWPDISADGKSIVYVGYTTDGFDLFEMSYPQRVNDADDSSSSFSRRVGVSGFGSPASSTDLPERRRRVEATETGGARLGESIGAQPANAPPSTKYSPLRTLKPTSWSPIVETADDRLRIGFVTGGFDVLGYHGYAISATWLASAPNDSRAPDRTVPDWQVAYAYDRWRPTVVAAASRDTSFFAGPADDNGKPSSAILRERQIETGVLFPIRHARSSNTFLGTFLRAADDFTLVEGPLSRTRAAARASWIFNSSRTYGYSISREDGMTLGTTTELVRRALGSSADATAFTVDGRAYLPLFARHHVLALRIGAGTSSGEAALRRTFHLGGSGPNAGPADFDRNAISLLRGFPSDTFGGRNVVLLNADYRFPLARPQRGFGTWPLFLHSIHAAAFADAGHVWNRSFHVRDAKSSLGGELSFDIVGGYFFRFTAALGGAWGHDGSGAVADRASVYLRVGHAF